MQGTALDSKNVFDRDPREIKEKPERLEDVENVASQEWLASKANEVCVAREASRAKWETWDLRGKSDMSDQPAPSVQEADVANGGLPDLTRQPQSQEKQDQLDLPGKRAKLAPSDLR